MCVFITWWFIIIIYQYYYYYLLEKLSHATMFFSDRGGFLLETLPNKPFSVQSSSNCAVMDFNMLSDTCSIWDVLFFSSLSILQSDLGSKLAWMFSPGKISTCLEGFLLINNLSLCRMLSSKLFGNGFISLSRLMHCKDFSMVDVVPSLRCIKKHASAPDKQTDDCYI